MEGRIMHFRQNRHVTYDNHMIVAVDGVSTKEDAEKLVGKNVTYNTGKKDLSGKVASAHGNSGKVRVIFERGMPGQSLGQPVKLS